MAGYSSRAKRDSPTRRAGGADVLGFGRRRLLGRVLRVVGVVAVDGRHASFRGEVRRVGPATRPGPDLPVRRRGGSIAGFVAGGGCGLLRDRMRAIRQPTPRRSAGWRRGRPRGGGLHGPASGPRERPTAATPVTRTQPGRSRQRAQEVERVSPSSVLRRRVRAHSVPDLRRALGYLREPDHGDEVLHIDLPAVDLL
jgi:hypothetical protein